MKYNLHSYVSLRITKITSLAKCFQHVFNLNNNVFFLNKPLHELVCKTQITKFTPPSKLNHLYSNKENNPE